MSEPTALRCVDCGHVHPVNGHLHTAAECRDALRTRLTAAESRLAEANRLLSEEHAITASYKDRAEAAESLLKEAREHVVPGLGKRLAEAEGWLRFVVENDDVPIKLVARIAAFLEGRTDG